MKRMIFYAAHVFMLLLGLSLAIASAMMPYQSFREAASYFDDSQEGVLVLEALDECKGESTARNSSQPLHNLRSWRSCKYSGNVDGTKTTITVDDAKWFAEHSYPAKKNLGQKYPVTYIARTYLKIA